MTNSNENLDPASLAFANFLAPKKAENLWFVDKDIVLDGYEFIECRFDNCRLHVSNAENVNLSRCYIGEDTVFYFSGGALAAVRLFHCKSDYFYTNFPYWVPERDDKGRITLINSHYSTLANLLDPKR